MVSELRELCLIVIPNLAEIEDIDSSIQRELKTLKLRSELVKELQSSRAYAAKLQVALNKASDLESKFDQNLKASNQCLNTDLKNLARQSESSESISLLFSNFPGLDWQTEGTLNEAFQSNRTPEPPKQPEMLGNLNIDRLQERVRVSGHVNLTLEFKELISFQDHQIHSLLSVTTLLEMGGIHIMEAVHTIPLVSRMQ